MILKRLSLLLTLFLFFLSGNSQNKVVRDIEAWTGASFQKQLGNKVELALEQEFRIEHNISQLYEVFSGIEGKYALNDQWRFSLGYRFIRNKTNSGDYESRYRINTDLAYRKQLNRLRISWRVRWQSRHDKDETLNTNNIRNRIALKYNIRRFKYTPYFSGEIFYGYKKNSGSDFNKFRLTFGTERNLSNKSEIRGFYRIEKELNEIYPKTTYIIGLRYNFGI